VNRLRNRPRRWCGGPRAPTVRGGCPDRDRDPSAPPETAARAGGPHGVLSPAEITAFVGEQLAAVDLDGRSLCVLVPEATRSCPLPLLLSAVHGAVHGRVSRLTVLVALGTHPGMTDSALAGHLATRTAAWPSGELVAAVLTDAEELLSLSGAPKQS
jgi:hypothetical protein